MERDLLIGGAVVGGGLLVIGAINWVVNPPKHYKTIPELPFVGKKIPPIPLSVTAKTCLSKYESLWSKYIGDGFAFDYVDSMVALSKDHPECVAYNNNPKQYPQNRAYATSISGQEFYNQCRNLSKHNPDTCRAWGSALEGSLFG